jgi:hypothetical protein
MISCLFALFYQQFLNFHTHQLCFQSINCLTKIIITLDRNRCLISISSKASLCFNNWCNLWPQRVHSFINFSMPLSYIITTKSARTQLTYGKGRIQNKQRDKHHLAKHVPFRFDIWYHWDVNNDYRMLSRWPPFIHLDFKKTCRHQPFIRHYITTKYDHMISNHLPVHVTHTNT